MNRGTDALLMQAYLLGYDAAARGLTPRAPALDAQWCDLLKGWQVGEGAAEMAESWHIGYQVHCDEAAQRILEAD